MIWGSVPSKPELGESREDQSVCIERTWVCGQVGSVVRHPQGDECVHWVQGGSYKLLLGHWYHENSSCGGAGNVCLLQAGCLPRKGGPEGAELCPPASFPHAY